MKEYPSILGTKGGHFGKPCYVFKKYDGSNLRCEWSKNKGWHKFGTRTRLFDNTDEQFGDAVSLFREICPDIEKRLLAYFKGKNHKTYTIFAEYWGERSFAGTHEKTDTKTLTLFDVAADHRIIPPKEFLEIFSDAPYAAEFLGIHTYGQELIRSIKKSELVSGEGVVCKGKNWTCKVKTEAFLTKLKEIFFNLYQEEIDAKT